MNDIVKIVKSIEASDLLIKDLSDTIKNEAEEQKRKIYQNFIRHFRC